MKIRNLVLIILLTFGQATFGCAAFAQTMTPPTVTTQRVDNGDGSNGARSSTTARTFCFNELGKGPDCFLSPENDGPNSANTSAACEDFVCGGPQDEFIVDHLLAFSGPNLVDINVAPQNITPFICTNNAAGGSVAIENNSMDRTSGVRVSTTNTLNSQHQVLNVGNSTDDDFIYTMKSTISITGMAPLQYDIMLPSDFQDPALAFQLAATSGGTFVRVEYDGQGNFSFVGTMRDENENPKLNNGAVPIDTPSEFGLFTKTFISTEVVTSNQIFDVNLFENYFVGTTTFFYDHVNTIFFATISCDVSITNEILLGDINGDGFVNLLDISGFVDLLSSGDYDPAADFNMDCEVDLLDLGPFLDAL